MISDRINEKSPWQDITEGNKLFEAATSREFKQANGELRNRYMTLKNAETVIFAFRCVLI